MSPGYSDSYVAPPTVTTPVAAPVAAPSATSMGTQNHMAAQMNKDLTAYQGAKLNCQWNANE